MEEIEYQVIALAFRQPGAIQYFSEHLPVDLVGLSRGNIGLQQFYEVVLDFYNRTGLDVVDPIAFRSWLSTESEIYEVLGGESHVNLFIENILNIELSTPDAVTQVIRHKANKRRQIDKLQELQLILSKKEVKTHEDLARISTLTQEIRDLETEVGANPIELLDNGLVIAEHSDGLWDLPDFLPTPFESLNVALGYSKNSGFVRGGVYSIIAASGMGKTTFARTLMNHWVDNGHPCLFVNYEEPRAHWERILFTQVTKQNVFKAEQYSEAEKQRYTEMFRQQMQKWGKNFMVRHDPETLYYEDLEKWLRDLVSFDDVVPEIIIIDTIQSMFTKHSAGSPRWGQYEQIIVALEKLAKDFNCVIIITSQENSNRLKEKREVVNHSDAGGSLTIIQKSTAAIFITPMKLASDDDSQDERIMQLQIPKNRITGVTFTADPPMVKYEDDIKSYLPYDLPPFENYDTAHIAQLTSFD